MTPAAQYEPRVAIVDYGLGNLFSVQHACHAVGLAAAITRERETLEAADAVILPGVGAFGDAMDTLRHLDLVGVIRDVAASGKPLLGICLGVQLLMTESYEFGRHDGLGIIAGQAIRLTNPREGAHILKVPQIGWNRIHPPSGRDEDEWVGTPLQGCRDGTFMYFVHSYVVAPDDASVVSSVTRYGDIEFCASVRRGNVFGCQFHPERSADDGLRVYANLHRSLGAANRSQSRSL